MLLETLQDLEIQRRYYLVGFFFFFKKKSSDEKHGSERVCKVIYINTLPRHQACGILYCSDYALKNARKNIPRLPKQVHVHQVVTGLQKTNKNVHQKNPPWSWPISCNFLTSLK